MPTNTHLLSIARADVTNLNRLTQSAVGFAVWDARQVVEVDLPPGSQRTMPADPIVASIRLSDDEEDALRARFVADGTVEVGGRKYGDDTTSRLADRDAIASARKIDNEPDFCRPGKKVRDL